MKFISCLSAVSLFCNFGVAFAAPNPQDYGPAALAATFQPQADRLASSISSIVKATEASSAGLSSASREVAIQSAVQGTIMASGYDPRVVLAALQAFSLCQSTNGKFTVSSIAVNCTDLRAPLSPEARQAIASLEKVIVAIVDQTDAPGALGL